ncbi:hypothetical protein HBI56_024110 [Parastagonospora nodorum]|uniref:Uncharacterized protein n=1 Tax=Phaeosphaeria nodorum (strain SN15 / ATCC MYA-4574 / FGSC 10173) TaxID=321614 RepID=A0A7U2I3S8_PHANO|nr:hypothetical protein HBH56_024380 [Parastagonospora nodorum]QRC98791.1 hypothetical protein JI435_061640 [Parastagonospora nodorum SN15]KAH3934521.1 hypothetical protein HBH54_057630 [Parastagonospora nodorum]KAH3949806.1 hypothetical protein HBH53_085320 [Parastagonospora nodorum]KAH3975798.1 hypothetical protein HBH51_080040 [Parastagonospora nodorum]
MSVAPGRFTWASAGVERTVNAPVRVEADNHMTVSVEADSEGSVRPLFIMGWSRVMSSWEPEPVHPQQPERRPSDMHTNARAMMRKYRDRKSLHACAAGRDKAECRCVVVGTGA